MNAICLSDLGKENDPAGLKELSAELAFIPDLQVEADPANKDGSSSLLIKLLSSGAIINLVGAIGKWLSEDRTRTLKIQIGSNTLEATRLTHEEQQQLIHWFQTQTGMRFEA